MRIIWAIVVLLGVVGACAVPDRAMAPAPSIPTIPARPPDADIPVPAPSATAVPTRSPQPPSSTPAPPKEHQALPARTPYRSCAEVRAAGKGPIRRGEPGFGSHLDHDGDGIACYPRKR